MQSPNNQQGIALIIVLWVILMLTVIASSIAFSTRSEINMTQNFRDTAVAISIAEAAASRAVIELTRSVDQRMWQFDGSINEWEMHGAKIRISIQDVAGLIDLNAGQEQLIRGILNRIKTENNELKNQITDAILDWRDPDNLKHLNGAEDLDYEQNEYAYRSKDRSFDSLDELKQIFGMTPEIYDQIESAFTIYSKQPGINPIVAPKKVLIAVPGVDANLVNDYIELRKEAYQQRNPIPPEFQMNGSYLASTSDMTYRIRINLTLPSGTALYRDAVVTRTENPAQPFTIVSWKNGAVFPEKENEVTEDEFETKK
ncbi:MAG: hypothetical protein HON94_01560 [Methylococcales bacterium]|jgi:general secretion pathway protein K|nr:hypothetical protein [Methylococcales bacterium]MBT7410664.1 hypothetical protein [Methylococcales bacterium]